ncbi:MAG: TerB family tellurite resistance protein [Cyclobacteriaceae bacterium]
MRSVEELLQVLVQLSIADNEFAKEEQQYIIDIGLAGGLTKDEVEIIVSKAYAGKDLNNLPFKDRLSYMVNLIQLMKVDGKVRRSEIEFCEKVAISLGYLPSVVADMSQYVYADASMINYPKLEEIARANSTRKD